MQTRAGTKKQSEQQNAKGNIPKKAVTPVKKANVRTTELSRMLQLVKTDPDSLSKDEFMLLQSAIGYRQTVKLIEEARWQQRLDKEKKPEQSAKQEEQTKQPEKAEAVQTVQKEKPQPVELAEKEPVQAVQEEAPEATAQMQTMNIEAVSEESTEAPQAQEITAAIEPKNKAIEQIEAGKENNPAAETNAVSQQNTSSAAIAQAPAADIPEKKQAPKQQIKIKGEDPGQILDQLGKVPPTEIMNAYSQAGDVSGGVLEKQRSKTQETIPEIPAPTGLAAIKEAAKKAGSKVSPINHKELAGFRSEKSGGSAQSGMLGEFNAGSGNEPDPEEIMAGARQYAANAPKIGMTGEADPSQVEGFKAEAAQNVQAAKQAEISQTGKDFGENRILPEQDHSILKAGAGIRAAVPPAIQAYKAQIIPPEVADRMNPSLTPMLENYMGSKNKEYQKGREQFDSGVTAAKADTNAQIEGMKTEAKEKQLKEQASVKAEVGGYRNQWKNEINTASAEYDREASTAAEEKKREIKGIKEEKEGEVKKTLKDAANEANKEYKAAKNEADNKKKEGEKDNRNIFQKAWDWTKEKAQQALDVLKKAVNFIFNKLRQAVKNIFDKAKSFAVSLIERGRQLVVGAIKKLGNVLKGLVRKVFARFPGIANKICGLIDRAVDKAIKAVNMAASMLKKGVTAALNLMAKTMDKLFAGVQALYNGILNGIGKFLKGDFMTIFTKALEVAQIAAEIALAFATGGGSVLIQIVTWLATTLPQLFGKVKAILGFVDTIRNMKLEDIKKLLNPAGIGNFLVKGLFGELSALPQGEMAEDKEEKEPESGREEKGLMKVFHILGGVFKVLKGVLGKVAGAINKVLPAINISNKPWFDPFSMIYAGAIKALEIVKNPGEALNEGAGRLKEAAGSFFRSIKTKISETAGSIKEKIMLLGQPAQLMKLIANKAVDMVLNFIITHPPSALIKAVFKAIEAVSGKSIVELVRQYIPFADKLINKIAESSPVQGLMKPLEQPVKAVGGMIDQVTGKAVDMVEDSEQKAVSTLGSGTKILTGLAGAAIGAKAASSGGGKKEEGGDFLGTIKGGIHTRLLAFGQKLLQSGKALLMKGVDKLRGMLTPKVKFRLGNEEHELWVEKGKTRNVVMMASEEGKDIHQYPKVDNLIARSVESKGNIVSAEEKQNVTNSDVQKIANGLQAASKGTGEAEDVVARIPEVVVKFKRNPKHDVAEFERQLKGQEKGLNSLTVYEFLQNRDRYIKEGRASEGNTAQSLARQEAMKEKVAELRKSGLSRKEANEQAEKWIKGQAALHNPDQIAGGNPLDITGVGDTRVNSSLGSQWKNKIEEFDSQIRGMTAKMTDEEKGYTRLNVKLLY